MTFTFLSALGSFPRLRMRRNRKAPWARALVRESALSASNLIWPAFVMEGRSAREPIATMPGVFRLSIDEMVTQAREAHGLGIPAIALFPAVDLKLKTDDAREAFNPENLVCRSVRAVKQALPGLGVICDVALDPYTTSGHDGLVINGEIANDETIAALNRQAIVQAQAGCDIIAPSDMMDGRVGALRNALDEAGYKNVQILSYAAKYASAFYGPFRDAVGSKGSLGKADKKTYQMDPGNSDEALREVALDIREGADMVMIKPGMPYLDIIARVKETFRVPVMAYQVSGEYAMLRAAADAGALDFRSALMESLTAFRRAGANGIFTYGALDAARWLKENG